jgi:hypothetical protein
MRKVVVWLFIVLISISACSAIVSAPTSFAMYSAGPLSVSQAPKVKQPENRASSWVWLWENYASGLNAIAAHNKSISVVSPNTYYLFDNGTFGVNSVQAKGVCPKVQSIGLLCEPVIQNDQSNPAGINTLLTSASLQTTFIDQAVAVAQKEKLDGYNVDFEPSSGIDQVSVQYGVFLTNFADAMHAVGKQLSVDVATWDGGALWNFTIEGDTPVNLVLTMGTYDSSYSVFSQQLQHILSTVPLGKIAIGLETASDDSTLSQRFQSIESSNVTTVMVWPSYPGFLYKIWWGNLSSYEKS